MKMKKTGGRDTWNHSQYSMFQNIWYCLKCTAQCYSPLLCWCVLVVLINVLLLILSTYLPKVVVERLTGENSLQELITMILAFMLPIAFLSGANKFLKKYIYHQKFRMNTFYLKRVALKGLTTDYINQENNDFRKLQTESFSCCNGNYSPLTSLYDVLIDLFTGMAVLSVFWILLVRLNWKIIIFLVLATVVSYLLNRNIMKWTASHIHEKISYHQRINYINHAAGDIRFAKDIRLYRMATWFTDIYEANMRGLAGWYRQLTSKLLGMAVYDSTLGLLRESVSYLYLLWLVWNHQISVADFILYFGVITGFSSWLGNVFLQISTLNQTNQKINYFRSYLEYPESYRRDGGVGISSYSSPKVIELKNVSYQYEGTDQYALRNINLKILSGEHLAVVGLNGAGKTTLVKLICGLADPTKGQVLYDGIDVREYNRTEYYRLFSAVFQNFSILPVTIEEIVSEAPADQVNPARVTDCLKAAGLWDKIEQLPKGVKSQFGKAIYDDGVDFSGGEVQKLLLSRTLYRHAPIMILDEPTAALDPIAESELYKNYDKISARKTTIFISHRLACTSFCDRVILIENGVICEEGTHRGLLALKNKYYHLFETQAKYYREKNQTMGVEK